MSYSMPAKTSRMSSPFFGLRSQLNEHVEQVAVFSKCSLRSTNCSLVLGGTDMPISLAKSVQIIETLLPVSKSAYASLPPHGFWLARGRVQG